MRDAAPHQSNGSNLGSRLVLAEFQSRGAPAGVYRYCYSMLHDLLNAFTSTPPWVVYSVIFLLVFVEDALFVGFVFPGETAVFVGGVLASVGHLNLAVVCVLVVAAAIIGDTVGYEIGKHYGERILEHRYLERYRAKLDWAQGVLRTRGGPAVFIARFSAFLRAVMPALAGTSRLPYKRFLVYNAAGGIIWGLGVTLLGFAAGQSYEKVASKLANASWIALGLIVVAAIAWWAWERRRDNRKTPAS